MNPAFKAQQREELVGQLMEGRRRLRGRQAEEARAAARLQVDKAKRALGERGPVWWTDGAPDHNRKLVRNSPYAAWFAQLPAKEAPA